MTFTLYSVTADNFYRLEYEINGLVGTFDDTSLPKLLKNLNSSNNLIYEQLCSLEQYINTGFIENTTITLLYQDTYDTIDDLTSTITSDLQTALPEHFI